MKERDDPAQPVPGVLRTWRDDPEFAQRYSGTLAEDEFVFRGQLARTPGDWEDDLTVIHRRAILPA